MLPATFYTQIMGREMFFLHNRSHHKKHIPRELNSTFYLRNLQFYLPVILLKIFILAKQASIPFFLLENRNFFFYFLEWKGTCEGPREEEDGFLCLTKHIHRATCKQETQTTCREDEEARSAMLHQRLVQCPPSPVQSHEKKIITMRNTGKKFLFSLTPDLSFKINFSSILNRGTRTAAFGFSLFQSAPQH